MELALAAMAGVLLYFGYTTWALLAISVFAALIVWGIIERGARDE